MNFLGSNTHPHQGEACKAAKETHKGSLDGFVVVVVVLSCLGLIGFLGVSVVYGHVFTHPEATGGLQASCLLTLSFSP